jgi:hypothetical protein
MERCLSLPRAVICWNRYMNRAHALIVCQNTHLALITMISNLVKTMLPVNSAAARLMTDSQSKPSKLRSPV